MELVVVGNISIDIVRYGASRQRTFLGGAGLNVAVAAARAGVRPKLVSVIGEDDANLLNALSADVDTRWVSVVPGKTCRFHIDYDDAGELQSISSQFGVAEQLTPISASLLLVEGCHYHVCCRDPLDPTTLVAGLTDRRYPYSLDFIASSITEQVVKVKCWMADAKYIFLNKRELDLLQTTCNITGLRTIIVTAGSDPIIVYENGNEVLRFAFVEKKFIEVTGAGDVFAGTYLAHALLGEELKARVRAGVLAAQISLSADGVWRIENEIELS